MIPHPVLTVPEIIRDMLSGEHLPEPVGGTATDVERGEAHVHLLELAQNPQALRTKCIACRVDLALVETMICQCGGFVCPACQASEPDDECNHIIPSMAEMAEL